MVTASGLDLISLVCGVSKKKLLKFIGRNRFGIEFV
jgi:hypothetical protein